MIRPLKLVSFSFNSYYPFGYSSLTNALNYVIGGDGIVVANDSNVYNYGRNGSFDFDGTFDRIDTSTFTLDGSDGGYTFGTWAKMRDSADNIMITGTDFEDNNFMTKHLYWHATT